MKLRYAICLLLAAAALPPRGISPPRVHPSAPATRLAARAAAPSVRQGPLIIPQPKSVTVGEGTYLLRRSTRWSVYGGRQHARLAHLLQEMLVERLTIRLRKPRLVAADQGVGLRIGVPPRSPGSSVGEWARNPEGYRLSITRSGIALTARTERGVFYGVQTLAQLLHKGEKGLECPVVTVEDWPSLSFRGAHWFPSASGVPFDRKLIRRVMARYKLNAAVIQCEAAQWRSHPEIAAPDSIPARDLRGLVALCHEQFIEPIPLINCLGHAEWIFRNGQHLDLAEDPRRPYACCVSNPDGDRFVKSILREALATFHPRYLHLGHDEATLRGPFPSPECPRCSGKSATELMLKSVNRYSAWLRARKVEPIIWGDMLLAPTETPNAGNAPNQAEAAERRAGLPRGMVVADWHYSSRPEYPSLELFQRSGLKPIACTWYGPANICGFSQAALRSHARGLLQTTWAGYFPNERLLSGREIRQFSAFILAADYAWSGSTTPPDALPYDPVAEFRTAYGLPSTRIDSGK